MFTGPYKHDEPKYKIFNYFNGQSQSAKVEHSMVHVFFLLVFFLKLVFVPAQIKLKFR